MSTSGFVQRKPLSVLRFVQRKSPEGAARFTRQQSSSTARLPQRELSSMARFAQQNPSSTTGFIKQNPSSTTGSAQQDPFNGSYHAWQDLRAMHDLRGLCSEKGPSLARCSRGVFPNGDFAGHFEYMESISCQNQLILDAWWRYLAREGRFYRPGFLRECTRAIFCQNAALRLPGVRFEGASFRGRAFVCPE